MADSEVKSIEDFEMWKVSSLKEYLTKHGIATDGQKKMLVARAFAAWEWKFPLKLSKEQYEVLVAADAKKALIMLDGTDIPNPCTLSNWLTEDRGMEHWPPTMLKDIGDFLERLDPSREQNSLTHRLSSEYKDH